jgi:hypothetical protein
MRTARGSLDSLWRDITRMFCPDQDEFFESQTSTTEGEKRNQHLYDSTGQMALNRFSSFMESVVTPRGSVWHTLRAEDDELNEDQDVKRWLYAVNNRLFAARNGNRSGFHLNMQAVFMGLGSIGNAGLFIDQRRTTSGVLEGCCYKSLFLGDTFIDVDFYGNIDTVYRVVALSARNIAEKWPDSTPPKVAREAEKNPGKMFDIIHAVFPNKEYDPARVDAAGMAYASAYILKEEQALLEKGGYQTFPIAFARYTQTAHEIYGRGPGTFVLPSMLTLNEMKRIDVRQRHKLVDPPLLVYDDGVFGGSLIPDIRPGALNPGGVDENGRQRIVPMNTGSRVDIGMEGMEYERRAINDAFFVSLFQILVQSPEKTATEVMMLMQEKGQLLGPLASRMESEFLGTLIERELSVLQDQGELPPPPPQFVSAGGRYKVQYENPINRLARAERLPAIDQTLRMVAPLGQINPDVYDLFDDEAIARAAAEGFGAPPDIVRSRKEVAALREQREARKQASDQMQVADGLATAMPKIARAQLDSAKANQITRG